MGAILKMRFLRNLYEPDLQDDRQRLDYEDAADKRQQQFLLDEYGDGADGAAQGERTDVAHEDFSRMRVVPEKTNGGAHHGAAKNGQLRDLRHLGQFQIIGENRVAADISQHRKRSGRDHGAADRQAVKAVGKVHGVAGADDDQHDKDEERQKRQRPHGVCSQLPMTRSGRKRLKKGTISRVEYSP